MSYNSNNKNYNCVCNNTTNGTTKNGNFFSGTNNTPTFLVTDSFLYATLVKTARYQNAGKTKFINKSLQINALGKWEGAPGGSGSIPRNQF